MGKIDSRPFWILCVMTLMVTCVKVFGGSMCMDEADYGMKTHQQSYLTKKNSDPNYLSGIVWYSQKYGRFDCCGLITSIVLCVSKSSDFELQVWNITDPATKTATFLVAVGNKDYQYVEIPFDEQIPIREGNVMGWIADKADVIKWGINKDEFDSDYLWEDFSSWSKAGDLPFDGHPPSFSTLLNKHTFANRGIEKRLFAVQLYVHPGYPPEIDNLPLSVSLYTTINKVNEVVHTFSVSRITALEKSIYITVDAQINPSDGFLTWNNTTEQVIIMEDLKKAVFEKPYEVKFTVSGSCYGDQTATLYVYVFDDDDQPSVCQTKQQRAIPQSAMWNQDQTDEFPAGVLVYADQWKLPEYSLVEAIEVCVSEPGCIDFQVWELSSMVEKKFILKWRYSVNGHQLRIVHQS